MVEVKSVRLLLLHHYLKSPPFQVGPEGHAICALSGGVDSTVAATLVHKALGDRLHCVFVDNGLLRLKVTGWREAECGREFLGRNPFNLALVGVSSSPIIITLCIVGG